MHATRHESFAGYRHGIRDNLAQFLHQLVQVFLVGLTLGMMRTVVPALAESEFGVPKGSFLLLMAFVVAFGFVKGTLNFVAGRLSERLGRKTVLLLGWAAASADPVHDPVRAELGLDRRRHGAARHEPGLHLVHDPDRQARHHPRRPARTDHGTQRIFRLRRGGGRRHHYRLSRNRARSAHGPVRVR